MMPVIELLKQAVDFVLHIDKNLLLIVEQYGVWSYGILFTIVFLETGVVVTPFLPGDSLLFATGALAASGAFSMPIIYVLLVAAAFLGDTVNYWIGHFIGPKAFEGNNRFFKKEHLNKAHAFYEKHGGVAIVLARFVPIVRTFAPFVAGVSKMSYSHFLFYNILGGAIWVSLFLFTGFYFGNLPFVKQNFEYVVFAIVIVSVVPMALEWWKAKKGH